MRIYSHKMDSTNVYVLRLKKKKWYIGSSNNVPERFKQHMSGEGCEWTRTYSPKRLHEEFPNCTLFDEDKYTKIYMAKYGIENVRGGAYCSVILAPETITHLEKELLASSGKCYHCKKAGHLINKCPSKTVLYSDQQKQHTQKLHEKARQNTVKEDTKTDREKWFDSLPRESEIKPVTKVKGTRGTFQGFDSGLVCYNCRKTGHARPDCPRLRCDKCHGFGHYANECNG